METRFAAKRAVLYSVDEWREQYSIVRPFDWKIGHPMTSRADVVGSPSGTGAKGAPRRQIVLRCYRAIILGSIVLIVFHLI
jgi:hypothetical protein